MTFDDKVWVGKCPASWCLAATLALACGPGDVDSAHDRVVIEVPRPGIEDGVFQVVAARVTAGSVPERFSRELPGSVAEYEETWADYPLVNVSRGLCAGNPEVLGRFQRAVAAALASGDDPAELRDTYGQLLEWCERPEQCAWAATAVEAGGGLAEVGWVALAQCPGDTAQALFERGGAPADTLIEYWMGRSWLEGYTPRWNPAMVAALGEVARAGDPWKTRSAAVLVSEAGERAALPLLALYDELPAGEVRDQVASSFSEFTHPRAKELFAEYCERSSDTDAVCRPDWSPLEGLIEPESESEVGSDSTNCLEPAGLEYLLTGGDLDAEYDTLECLNALLAVDRVAAIAQARTVHSWKLGETELGILVTWLDAFPEEGQLAQALRELGLLPRGPLPGVNNWPGELDLTPGDVMARSGPVSCFDLETGQFPNQHDRLLYDLSELAGPPLDAAVFEEVAPPFELSDGGWWVAGHRVDTPPPGVTEGMPYRLRAFLGGRIYETDAQDFGDWYDLDRVLGLLNAVAAAQGVQIRAVALPTGDQTVCVLVAPREAILAGIQAGLLQVATGGATERALKQEQQALEQLEQQGLEPLIAEPEGLMTPE